MRFRMTAIVPLEEIIAKNERSKALLSAVENELLALKTEVIKTKKMELEQQNEKLRLQVEDAKQQLIFWMKQNGKQHIPVPGARGLCSDASASTGAIVATTAPEPVAKADAVEPKKEKKPKKEKVTAPLSVAPEQPVDVGRLDLRVGKIIEVTRHPDADSLYVEKIDCGEGQPRTVVSGLVKHVPIQEMQDRLVIVLCNLKPAKMRGVTSEAMVMCASSPDRVEILNPPLGAVPGDLVCCEGYNRQPDAQLNPKKKIFETVAPDLMTNNESVATYKGSALYVPGKDVIKAKTLTNAQVK